MKKDLNINNEFNDAGIFESYDIGHDYAKYTSSTNFN